MKLLKKIIIIMTVLLLCTAVFAETVGVLKFYKGRVLIKKSVASKRWIRPKLNMRLDKNYIIKTGKNAEVRIRLKNGSIYTITGKKIVKMKEVIAGLKQDKSKKSSILAKLNLLKNKLGKGGKSATGSVTAVAGVRGADVSKKSKSPIKPTELIWEE